MHESNQGDVAWMVPAEVEDVFALFVTTQPTWSTLELDSLCEARPELATDLRRLAGEWRSVAGLFARAGLPADVLGSTLSSRMVFAGAGGRPARSPRFDPGCSLPGDAAHRWDGLDARLQDVAQHCADSGRYVRPELLGSGGMGDVWRVRDTLLDRDVALKVVKDDLGAAPHPMPAAAPLAGAQPETTAGAVAREIAPHTSRRRLARFEREVRILGALDHPGILRIHDFGLDARGRPYFTMPVVEGRHFGLVIEDVWRRRARRGRTPESTRSSSEPDAGAWDLARAVGVLHRVGEAMAYAHERGVVHRDLKPTNVMVGRFGEAYVMDWGLAKPLDGAPHAAERAAPADAAETDRRTVELTLEGRAVGTAAFMAPEQAQAGTDAVGPATDVYALGAMLYQLLAGHPPYLEVAAGGGPQVVIERLLRGPPRSLDAVHPAPPAELVAICERAMARKPADRYPDMQAFAGDLRAWLDGRVVRAHRTGAVVELSKWVRRNRLAAAGLAAAVLALMSSFVVSVNAADEQRKLTTAATNAATNERIERERADEEAARATAAAERATAAEADARHQLRESRLRAVQLASQRGKWNAVIDTADAALALDADQPQMHVLKARALIALARSEDARKELTRAEAVETPGTAAERLLLQGYVAMLEWGSGESAIDLVGQAIEAELPSSADEAFAYALIQDTAPAAQTMFEASLKADPFHFLAWDGLVQTQFWRGRFSEALRTADRMADVFPDDPTPDVIRCSVACLTGDEELRRTTLESLKEVFDEQALADFAVFLDVATEGQALCSAESIAYFNMPTEDVMSLIMRSIPRLQTIRSPVLVDVVLARTPNLPFVGSSYGRLPSWFFSMVRGDIDGALVEIDAALRHNPAPLFHFLKFMTLGMTFDSSDEASVQRLLESLAGAASGETLLPSMQTGSMYLKAFLTGHLNTLRPTEAARRAQALALRDVLEDPDMPSALLAQALRQAAGIGEMWLAQELLRRWREVTDPSLSLHAVDLALKAGAPWLAIEEADRWLSAPPSDADAEATAAVRTRREKAVADLSQRLDAWRASAP